MDVLKNLKPGEIFRGASGREYIVLENNCGTIKRSVAFLDKERVCRKRFSVTDNKFDGGDLDRYLQEDYYNIIKSDFDNKVAEHEIDMFSVDGLDTYGKCKRKVSLLTLMMYQKYRRIIGHGTGLSWWLATPWSTDEGIGASFVACVGSDGDVCFGDYGFELVVRPFFIVYL